MGVSGSSSKRKYSKRKSSKISSEAHRRKKSRRTKSKKLRCRPHSVSYSDDDSRRSTSVSSSSSEDDYRRARSRKRSDVKGSRKRAERSSSSRESGRDLSRAKRRKGLKRKVESEVRKKSKKKKHRRDASISSISNDSRSFSTCRGGSGSGEESDFGRPRGRSRENNRDKRDLTTGRSGTKNNKIRSRSSSCHRCSDSSNYSNKQKFTGKNSSRRLRSVVTVPKQPEEEERERDKDGHKEEIEYDHDDYPSCRSNDSNDWGGKRDLAHHLHVTSENVKGEESPVSNMGKDDQSNPCSDAVGVNNSKEKNTEVSATTASSDGGDLESILRQKALENLRKFQGGLQTNAKILADQKIMNGSNVKQSTVKAEFVQNKLPREGGSRVLGATQAIDQNSRLIMMRDSSRATRIDQKIQEPKYCGTESGTAGLSVVCPPDQVALSGNPQEKDISLLSVTNNSESGRLALREESLGTCSILKQSPMSQASPKSKLVVTNTGVNDSAAETSETVDQTSNKHDIEITNTRGSAAAPEHSSCLKPRLEEHNSNEQQEEAKEGSQFEQKTMSVMRGGEMVQVRNFIECRLYIIVREPQAHEC
ncbi:hypothetical protein F0562_010356 [Nyssa sinensis]|uniref:Uncharacterized protein n=1 Tax=Nyssa sinensis TaxID=561372 RepID=A0A5J4ZYM7_9ASTE|nr:hypothetical protein F0562_010356 [Nyssa sinensis]